MEKKNYFGMKVELASKMIKPALLVGSFHKVNDDLFISDIVKSSKMSIKKVKTFDKAETILSVCSDKHNGPTNLMSRVTSFSLGLNMGERKSAERLAQIINILGNDKIIREKISTFHSNLSVLNQIPELAVFVKAFEDIDKITNGDALRYGWYYAPEVVLS